MGTVNHHRYNDEVLPVPLKFGNDMFDNHWTFQQDERRARIHQKTEDWRQDSFPIFVHWPPKSRDLAFRMNLHGLSTGI